MTEHRQEWPDQDLTILYLRPIEGGPPHEKVQDYVDRLAHHLPYTLVTSLDSDPNVLEILHPVLSGLVSFRVGAAKLVHSADLVGLGNRLFHGFDEVWMFRQPPTKPKPDGVWLTDPRPLDASQVSLLSPWFEEQQCYVGVGDISGDTRFLYSGRFERDICGF